MRSVNTRSSSDTSNAYAGGRSVTRWKQDDVHDFVWRNGNVPLSLQRWELLGDRRDVDLLDAAGRWDAAPPTSGG